MVIRLHPLFWSLSFGLILFGVERNPARADEPGQSYKVAHSKDGVIHHGVLTVDSTGVGYSELEAQSDNFHVPCADFVKGMFLKKTQQDSFIQVPVHWGDPRLWSDDQEFATENLFQSVEVTCETPVAMSRADLDKIIAADHEAAVATRKANFRKGIFAALRAADEPDPFASIRGEFDLSAPDSRQWKTNFQLAGADTCTLLKTPPATPTSPPVWTFGCMFPASGDGYEDMVKSVQSILNLPYQPDERAVNINQVFFADPSKPARRVFVAKINEVTIGLSVVAVRSAGALVDFNAASFPGAPTVLPTAPTISEEIEKVRISHNYTALPPIQSTSAPATSNGMAVFEVKNNTPYTLTALFSGPTERRVEVAPRGSISIDLQPGSYKLVGRVNAPDVLPSYGEHVFDASNAGVAFYIQ